MIVVWTGKGKAKALKCEGLRASGQASDSLKFTRNKNLNDGPALFEVPARVCTIYQSFAGPFTIYSASVYYRGSQSL